MVLILGANLITSYNIDYSTKKVSITTAAKIEELYTVLSKTGKDFVHEETKLVESAKSKVKMWSKVAFPCLYHTLLYSF